MALHALRDATIAWGELQRQTDAAFIEVLRRQNELGAKRLAQTRARLILLNTPDGPPAEPMRPGLHA